MSRSSALGLSDPISWSTCCLVTCHGPPHLPLHLPHLLLLLPGLPSLYSRALNILRPKSGTRTSVRTKLSDTKVSWWLELLEASPHSQAGYGSEVMMLDKTLRIFWSDCLWSDPMCTLSWLSRNGVHSASVVWAGFCIHGRLLWSCTYILWLFQLLPSRYL